MKIVAHIQKGQLPNTIPEHFVTSKRLLHVRQEDEE
jgi:hypothetical protein